MDFTIYKKHAPEAGKIMRFGMTVDEENALIQLLPEEQGELGLVLLRAQSFDEQYVIDDQIVDRPAMPAIFSKHEIAADGLDACVISNVPAGGEAVIGEQIVQPTDGAVTLTSTIPGEFVVTVRCWPFLDFLAIVEAV